MKSGYWDLEVEIKNGRMMEGIFKYFLVDWTMKE